MDNEQKASTNFSDYKHYLESQTSVPPNKTSYYISWVKMYLKYADSEHIYTASPTAFCNDMSLSNKYFDWQILQARKAISHYFAFTGKTNPDTMKQKRKPADDKWKSFIEMTRTELQLTRKSYQTEKTYLRWLTDFASFINKPPSQLLSDDVKHYLSYLATTRHVATSTQKQAFNALLFFYRHIIHKRIENLEGAVRAQHNPKLPVVMTPSEISRVFNKMEGTTLLMSELIYGSGMRLNECLNLRIKDLDFERGTLLVRSGKGNKDRQTLLPAGLNKKLNRQIKYAETLYIEDRNNKVAGVAMPSALAKKK
ncbi:MAG: phage integrase N-terminal SAM-like domain-containing protein [Spirochaetales bacterium]|uniref:Phage integrase N-terminal SAM-like domain-containing protein n=1 Tax=Candidatus Thalassospirochaeta sargassi TaxID=3119039 RepID=A0AAJ1II45_9SPIO|nr:phage integrase N-terminal SAM-like domain-containing protein [Spirochaetales bacterium]